MDGLLRGHHARGPHQVRLHHGADAQSFVRKQRRVERTVEGYGAEAGIALPDHPGEAAETHRAQELVDIAAASFLFRLHHSRLAESRAVPQRRRGEDLAKVDVLVEPVATVLGIDFRRDAVAMRHHHDVGAVRIHHTQRAHAGVDEAAGLAKHSRPTLRLEHRVIRGADKMIELHGLPHTLVVRKGFAPADACQGETAIANRQKDSMPRGRAAAALARRCYAPNIPISVRTTRTASASVDRMKA